jgi:pimeloyl-ACP methyl ester carboxylesterase
MNSVNHQKISEKQIKINGLNINYKTIGDGEIPIVLLPGWGVSSDKYLELIECLSQFSIFNFQFSILIPDLPGFGKSDEPEENWNLDDYVEFVDKFIKSVSREKKGFELVKDLLQRIRKDSTALKKLWSQQEQCKQYGNMYYHTEGETVPRIVLVGHSFGGRIAIKYAVKYPEKIQKLILTGAAGIKHKPTMKQKIFYNLAKVGKSFFVLPIISKFQKYARKFLYKIAKEKDYYRASPRMKEIMKNILAEDLTPILKKIKTPTLLVWGKLDNSTPLADGKLMNKKIENSELVIFNNANHGLPYQKPEKFAKAIEKFIK